MNGVGKSRFRAPVRHQYYDAALLAAAERLGASIFYSEDLSHRQTYGSVTVINPFIET
jgi:predicted nucleic acid-binding protein